MTRDGRLFISAGAGEIIIRDARTLEVLRKIKTERSRTRVITTNPEGTLLAMGGHDGVLEIYDLKTGERKIQQDLKKQWIEWMKWTPTGKSIILKVLKNPGGGFAVWDVKQEKLVRNFKQGGQGLIISPDGQWVASGEREGSVTIFKASNGWIHRRFEHASDGYALALAFSPDGETLLTGGTKGDAKLWNVDSGQLLKTLPAESTVVAGAFFPDGDHVVLGMRDARKLVLWDLKNNKLVATADDVSVTNAGMVLLPSGQLATAGAQDKLPKQPAEPSEISIWQLPESVWPKE